MFIGHYGPSYAVKAVAPSVPMWLAFVAAQAVDIAWAALVLLGVEKARIVPGITASNPFDLYYMPYTHSLAAAILWSLAAVALCRPLPGARSWAAAAWIGAVVLSHWFLDLLVHRADLPLYDDAMKVGLGLWNYPWAALLLEAALLFGGMALYMKRTRPRNAAGRIGPPLFCGAILGIQAYSFLAAPPATPEALAAMALLSFVLYAAAAEWLDRQRSAAAG